MADSDECRFGVQMPVRPQGSLSGASLLGVTRCLRCLNDLQAHRFDCLCFEESSLCSQASIQAVIHVPLHEIGRSQGGRRRRLLQKR